MTLANVSPKLWRDKLMHNQEQNTLIEAEAAAYIGMSRSWMRQARMNGLAYGPPYLKIGRAIRFLKTDLDQWLESRRIQTETEVRRKRQPPSFLDSNAKRP